MTVRIIAFTGHRPNKLGGYDPGNPIASRVIERLDRCIRAAVQYNGTRVFLSGMALGVDQWAAQLVSLYRAELELDNPALAREIKLVACIPCTWQAVIWPPESQRQWWNLLEQADKIVVCGDNMPHEITMDQLRKFLGEIHRRRREGRDVTLSKEQISRMMMARNRFMVDHADGILAVWDGSKGGTGNCVSYALKKGKPVTVIDPATGLLKKLSNDPV